MTDRCTAVRPLIHDYLEGELAETRAEGVREHLDRCRGCRGHAEAWIDDLELLLAVETPLPPGHWNALRRKLRWRGQRAATHAPASLQILCAIAALVFVFGVVGFLVWLESRERGDGNQFVYDVAQGELSFQLARGERCRIGAVELSAKTGAPQALLRRLGAGETWELRVLWGEIALRKGDTILGLAKHEERWHLPVGASSGELHLALHARCSGVDLGPWPVARIVRRDGAHAELLTSTDEAGRCHFELPLRVDPPLAIEVEVEGRPAVQLDLPSVERLAAEANQVVRFLEIDPERHVQRIALHDAAQEARAGVRLSVERVGVSGGARAEATSSVLGIVELPLWFAGPYAYRVLDVYGAVLLSGECEALPASLVLPRG